MNWLDHELVRPFKPLSDYFIGLFMARAFGLEYMEREKCGSTRW